MGDYNMAETPKKYISKEECTNIGDSLIKTFKTNNIYTTWSDFDNVCTFVFNGIGNYGIVSNSSNIKEIYANDSGVGYAGFNDGFIGTIELIGCEVPLVNTFDTNIGTVRMDKTYIEKVERDISTQLAALHKWQTKR